MDSARLISEKRLYRLLEMLNYYSDSFANMPHADLKDLGAIGATIITSILNYQIALLLILKDETLEILASKGIEEDKLDLLNSEKELKEYLWNEIDSPTIVIKDRLDKNISDTANILGLGEVFLSIPLKTTSDGKVETIGIAVVAQPPCDFDLDLDIMALEIIASLITGSITNRIMKENLLLTNESLRSEIAERKRVEDALRESEENYRTIFENTGTATVIIGEDTEVLMINKEVENLTGYSKDEIEGRKKWPEFIVEEEHERLLEYHRMRRINPSGVPRSYETRITDRHGNIKHVLVTAAMVPGTKRSMASVMDITVRSKRECELEAIAKISSALRTASTRSDMIPIVLEQILDLLDAEGVAIAMRDTVTGETVIEMAKGIWSHWTDMRLQPGEGISGYVIEKSLPYISNDIRNDPLLKKPDVIGDMRSACCVPMIAQGQAIGALWIGRKSNITGDEVRLLTSISDIAANAIYRTTLYEQTEGRMQRMTALRSIDMAITSSLDLRVTLNVLLDQVISQLKVDAATVLLLNPYSKALEYTVGRGFRSFSIQQTKLRLGEGHAGKAALKRRIVSIPNVLDTDDPCVRSQMLAGELFIAHHAVPLVAKGQVKGVLEVFHRSPLAPEPEWLEFFEALAVQAAIAIENASLFDELQRSNIEISLAYDSTLEGWSHALDMRDKETEGHTMRVTDLTLKLARHMGFSESELVHIRRGSLLHDIGKMGIPDCILLKNGPLTEQECEIMQKHPLYAYEMLLPITFLRQALNIPYCHHERWDGTGYPRGLKGEQIPLEARIFAIVDVWDAMRSDRPYRPALSEKAALEYIREQSGKHFDPKVVEVFLKMVASDTIF